jgi:hypothetical protein
MLRMSLTRSICPPFRPPSSGKQSPSGKVLVVLCAIQLKKNMSNSFHPLKRPCSCSMNGQVPLCFSTELEFQDFTTKKSEKEFLSISMKVLKELFLRHCYVPARYMKLGHHRNDTKRFYCLQCFGYVANR